MIAKYFSIYDKKANLYGQLFPAPTIGSAERMLSEQVNRIAPDNIINRHPSDFALYYHFEIDDNTGNIVDVPSIPQLVCEASAFVS